MPCCSPVPWPLPALAFGPCLVCINGTTIVHIRLGVQTFALPHGRHRTILYGFEPFPFASPCFVDEIPHLVHRFAPVSHAPFRMVTGSRSGWISSNDLTPVSAQGCVSIRLWPRYRPTGSPISKHQLVTSDGVCIDLVPCANGLGGHHRSRPLVARNKSTIPFLRPFAMPARCRCQTSTAHGDPTANTNIQSQLVVATSPRVAEPVPNCSQSRAQETRSCLVNSVVRKDLASHVQPSLLRHDGPAIEPWRLASIKSAWGCHLQPASACPHDSHATCQGGGLSERSDMAIPKARLS
ncbi:hypothetical protein BDP81DRAFT_84966 [Colletotrichum phormii]|uniref:Uncharacterized protein n=1 Tax=Colletotrichum phormii TaxID=359342 RepID=A0AAJ0A4N3_9PEZI|nr:uncharacterized protein BDP81DRAFT_84966 [Colletotrichum phormii]KAK1654535.1 hypothetical protein BDP81DRAFT_84966 [Colletotrichum phormii]